MKKYILYVLVLCCTSTISQAQNAQSDTLRLLLYNTGANFLLTTADFSGKIPQDLIGTMVRAYDTVIILKQSIERDSSGKNRIKNESERRADKISKDIKDKIVVMEFNKDVDITQTCMNVQRGGATALILIHQSNKKNEIKLTKVGLYKDSIRIPCFTLQNSAGDSLYAMLPSAACIKLPKIKPLSLVAANPQSDNVAALAPLPPTKQAKTEPTDNTAPDIHLNNPSLGYIGWAISPNPADNEAVLQYNFKQAVTVNIDIFNEVGQLINNKQLTNIQSGKLIFDVTTWQSGVYNVILRNGTTQEVKRLVVTH